MRDTMMTVRTRRAQLATIVSGQKTRSAQVVASINAIVAAAGLAAIDAVAFGFFNDCAATDSVSIAATDRTLTSPDNPWTAGDVGKLIHVAGAGVGGAVMVSRIAAYTNAGSVELATPATTTVAATKTSVGGLAAWGFPADEQATDDPARDANSVPFQASTDRSGSAWIQAEITKAQNAGGGVIVIPPGVWSPGILTISGPGVTIFGYGATLVNSRITATAAASDLSVIGLRVLDDRSDSATYLMDISATRFLIENVTLEKSPAAGGYQAYIRDVSSYGIVRGLRTFGSNGIYIAGHDHVFIGCELESNMAGGPGGDDGYVVKGLGQTYNISITGGTVRGHQAILSIGSEVGTAAAAGDYSKFVRNVTVTGVAGYNCAMIAYIKPGAITADYRNGMVEDITISGCSLIDPAGFLYQSAFQILAGRGCIVRNVNISDCTIRARARTQVLTSAHIFIAVNNVGDAGTVEDITISNVSAVDVYDGVANDGSHPGYPIDYAAFIECPTAGFGTIKRITVRDYFCRGTRIAGVYTGTLLTGPIRFERPIFRKIANNPPGAVQGGFYAGTEMGIYDAEVEVLTGRAVGADGLVAATYKSQKATFNAGIFAAGNNGQCSGFIAPFDCYIWKVEVANNGAIAQSDADYTTIELRNMSTGDVLVSRNTKATGGIAIPDDAPVSMSAATLVGVNAFLPAGSALRWAKTDSGAGKSVDSMNVIISYVPYSR